MIRRKKIESLFFEMAEGDDKNKKSEEKKVILIDLTMDEEKKRNIDFFLDLTALEIPSKRKAFENEQDDIGINFREVIVFPGVYTRAQTNSRIQNAIARAAVAPVGILPPAILALPGQVAAMQAQIDATQAQIAATQAQIQVQIAASQVQIQAQIVASQVQTQQQLAFIQEQLAIINNRACSTIDYPLQARQGVPPGPLPPGFPQTLEALHGMDNDTLAPFLAYFALAAGGNNRARQRRLALFLGVPQQFA